MSRLLPFAPSSSTSAGLRARRAWGASALAAIGVVIGSCGPARAASPAAAPGTLRVEEAVSLPVAPAAVWAVIGDFSSLAWHPAVAATQLTQGAPTHPGAVRDVSIKDGAHIIEVLQAYSAAHHAMTYRFVQSPLPVRNYVSTLSVKADGHGSRVVWSSRFDRDPAAAGVDDEQARTLIRGIYQTGLDALRQQLGSAPH